MSTKKKHYPWFGSNDLSAFWALLTDNLTNLIVLSGVCKFVFDMPAEIVFGTHRTRRRCGHPVWRNHLRLAGPKPV
jgi:hypothetical protein